MYDDGIYRVVLFGHSRFDGHKKVDKYLSDILYKLLNEKQFVEIYIGRNGEFDIYAASIIKRLQSKIENIELICVLPYKYKDIDRYEDYYDSVMIMEMERFHPKRAIIERNQKMIEMCDILICYVEHYSGGAYRAMRYAQGLKKEIINLAEM